MASFHSYLPLLLQVEGGYQDNPKDKGNYNSKRQNIGTNYGVSGRFYESYIGRVPSKADMLAITKKIATEIYRSEFWEGNKISLIVDQSTANTIVDHIINAGDGVRLAQRVLKQHFGYSSIKDDGIMGNITLTALNSVNQARFVTKYNEARALHYRTRSNSAEFADGWLTRLKKFSVQYQSSISIVVLFLLATTSLVVYHQYKN